MKSPEIICFGNRAEVPPNKTGRITQQRETFYDVANNRCKLIEKVFGGEPKEHVTIWTYDVMNRISILKEAVGTAEEKATRYIRLQRNL